LGTKPLRLLDHARDTVYRSLSLTACQLTFKKYLETYLTHPFRA